MTEGTIRRIVATVMEQIRQLGNYGKQDNPLLVATQAELESAVIRAVEGIGEYADIIGQRKDTIDYIDAKWREGIAADADAECPYDIETDDLAARWWHRGNHAAHPRDGSQGRF